MDRQAAAAYIKNLLKHGKAGDGKKISLALKRYYQKFLAADALFAAAQKIFTDHAGQEQKS